MALQFINNFKNVEDLCLRVLVFDQFRNEVIDLSALNNLRNLKIASNSYDNISECLTDFKFNLNEHQRNIKFEIKMTNASASLSDFFDLISAY